MTDLSIIRARPDVEGKSVPLVVDLDGTLLKSDLLAESFLRLLAERPLAALAALGALAGGKAALKARIAEAAELDVSSLPYDEELLDTLRDAKRQGRRIILASASDRRLVEAVAAHLGVFDDVLASDGETNLRGAEKARALCALFGEGGFDYAGDARVDLEVWAHARRAIAVNCRAGLEREVRRRHPNCHVVSPRRFSAGGFARAIRVHQWAKNLLLLLPMLTAHAATWGGLGALAVAFLAFSLTASAVYLVNDLIDLPSDREHATKRFRPLASGSMSILGGMALAPAMLAAGFALGAAVSWQFLGILALYLAVTTAYSMVLKRKAVVDVITLAGLYSLRVLAGAVAIGVEASAWLLGFSIFLFLCLALVKRAAELQDRLQSGKGDPLGRGYRLTDLPVIQALAGASGYAAVVVLALYVNSPDVIRLYTTPEALWLVCGLLLYWVSRTLLITHRGEMHEDPVVFALRDRTSQVTLALTLAIIGGSSL